MFTVFRRELGQYFASPIAYLIAAAFLLMTGILFNNDLTLALGVRPLDAAVVPEFLSFGLIFFAPLLTMRMIAEETREGTMELLLTAPVSDTAIVLGKFLAAWAFYSFLLALTFGYQVLIMVFTSYIPDLGQAIAAYMGIWLYGGAALAIGLTFSAVSENQIVAAFLSITVLMLLWLGEFAAQSVASIELARVIRELTVQGHFATSFAHGLLRAEDIAYFAGIIVVMLFITIRIVESRRWR